MQTREVEVEEVSMEEQWKSNGRILTENARLVLSLVAWQVLVVVQKACLLGANQFVLLQQRGQGGLVLLFELLPYERIVGLLDVQNDKLVDAWQAVGWQSFV